MVGLFNEKRFGKNVRKNRQLLGSKSFVKESQNSIDGANETFLSFSMLSVIIVCF
jgi:hypothetical protein